MAAEAFGAGRSWFLSNGATQGNHALCLALAPLGTRVVVQRNSHGMAADVAALAHVAHAAGVPLVVDQAWGPHFGFHDALPPTALSQGGDAMLTSTHKAQPGTTAAIVGPAKMLLGEMAVPPREAFLGQAELVSGSDAAGRISCESIASYPAGVPQLLPGERSSDEIVAHLSVLAATGPRLYGASDPRFRTINVLREGD